MQTAAKQPNVYTVSKINSYIANMFREDFLLKNITVKGEISNLKYHTSGHVYFTIKDEKSALGCMMYASDVMRMKFRMEEGMLISVHGQIRAYERDGIYKLYADAVEKEGAGELYERFLRLRDELEELGMFAPEYKQQLPSYPRILGVVTAQTGAAIRDILNVALRRNPYLQIILYPAIVQGEQAVPSIVSGIRALERAHADVMIVGRGGGSIEDLWAFNSREVAQAVFDCSVPVVSAVGHETDTTIIDFVADLRAPTPSAAAELAVPDISGILGSLEERENTLTRLMKQHLVLTESRVKALSSRLEARSPENRIRNRRAQLSELTKGLTGSFTALLTDRRHTLDLMIERLRGLSPLDKLSQGYSYTEHEGKTVRSVSDVSSGDGIRVWVRDGVISARVEETEKRKPVNE